MATGLDEFEAWLSAEEGARFEFKEAKTNFHFDRLVQYAAAIANEGGGKIVLGVTDPRPRKVVGTKAFVSVERTKQGLIDRLRLRFEVEEMSHPHGRVVIVHVPARPLGMPVHDNGTYWMRSGDSLVPMAPDMLKGIFEETGPDFSSEVCAGATPADFESRAIEDFRQRWMRHSGNAALARLPAEQILSDAELLVGGQVTYAALILLGSPAALGKRLAQAEVIFEYRSSDASLPAQQRVEYRQGFFAYYEDLWRNVNSRNDRQSYQDGLFRLEIPTFDEQVIREAILNAVSHRDYRLGGSVFVRQFPRRMEIVSPGGLPAGITPENILDRQSPRNRRIAEAFARCGLIERSGQGINRMFEQSIKQSKPLPDFSGSDEYQVSLVIRGDVQDAAFVRFLERLGAERLASFGTHDFLVLDAVRNQRPVPENLRERLDRLVEFGVIERLGRGRGARLMLSKALYAAMGATGAYTRKRGLDHETNKALLLKHLKDGRGTGSPLSELQQVLPALSARRVQRLMDELRQEKKVRLEGRRRWARWFFVSPGDGS
ncbi:MAG: transcriptional regulator [Betaproteobacteria bacterium RIFCSPLOWO2_12_FULL_65_14]|nr:MAG: transcriptional regulator [Betaproteobacteria bacterium RIFCSPLOWO2_12_FULL_65_14]